MKVNGYTTKADRCVIRDLTRDSGVSIIFSFIIIILITSIIIIVIIIVFVLLRYFWSAVVVVVMAVGISLFFCVIMVGVDLLLLLDWCHPHHYRCGRHDSPVVRR